MELVMFGKEVIHGLVEQAASYRLGQATLKQIDRALWVVEKCARWAVPPPLDQDERPQPELVRPVPWVIFLTLLVVLRATRESISLVNLALGKPPLRSADVVIYIQTKRRYLRTLKYQGNRILRARNASSPRLPWYKRAYSLAQFTMCFRGASHQYGNNNTQVNSSDEVLVVKRTKRPRDSISPVTSSTENTMERLIEKMMVDMDADLDDDSDYTLTNATSEKSDYSVNSGDSEDNDIVPNGSSTPAHSNNSSIETSNNSSIETSNNVNNVTIVNDTQRTDSTEKSHQMSRTVSLNSTDTSKVNTLFKRSDSEDCALRNHNVNKTRVISGSALSFSFLQSERQQMSKKKIDDKISNGRMATRISKKSKGELSDRRTSDVPLARITTNENPY